MPELPEVARTSLSLNERLKGNELKEIRIHSGRYFRHGPPSGMMEVISSLPARIESVDFYGKMIMFTLKSSNGIWWIKNTLGMSGGWKSAPSKHGHIEFVTDKNSTFFTDPRNFGTLTFIRDEKIMKRQIESIGPNHLRDSISDDLFQERISRLPHVEICSALMNQSLIGGIGNYIKAEVLYRAKISPKRLVKDITKEEFSRLNRATEEVIRGSFLQGGASIRSYSGMNWERGEYPFFFQVYGRKMCHQGYPVITETTSDGRTTHWVLEIQK
jgi:DNA-formamidopyrimidine glycosylase